MSIEKLAGINILSFCCLSSMADKTTATKMDAEAAERAEKQYRLRMDLMRMKLNADLFHERALDNLLAVARYEEGEIDERKKESPH